MALSQFILASHNYLERFTQQREYFTTAGFSAFPKPNSVQQLQILWWHTILKHSMSGSYYCPCAQAPHHDGVWGRWCNAPHTLNLGTSRKWVAAQPSKARAYLIFILWCSQFRQVIKSANTLTIPLTDKQFCFTHLFLWYLMWVCNKAYVHILVCVHEPAWNLMCYSYIVYFVNYIYLYCTASVVLWPEFLAIDPEVPGSIPGATRFSEK
jgi:hypothetical protein